ncbi:alanine racemase [Acinetobacter sp. c2-A9]|uniref:alanine racemase n=1 Tax=Acinetobacter sp. c2-A9 TaxID=3342802 RepID=UPI0035B8408C
MRHTEICIDYTALQHNLQRVRQLAPTSQVVAMVKANAYGHGVENVLDAFHDADVFGVACLQEALQIRQLGCNKPITLIEGVFSVEEMPIALANKCECMVHQQQQIDWLLQYKAQYQQANLKVWLKINTGMNRLGFKIQTADDIDAIVQPLLQAGFKCVITMHFANADELQHPLNQQQIQLFKAIQNKYPELQYSCCNSAAIYNWADLHADYVRPGIMLYGASPFADKSCHDLGLKAVMHFNSQIMQIFQVNAGESIGYASSFVADKTMTVAVVAVGYGDGYPRAYQQDNFVNIAGHQVKIIGRISMDMITIDITDIANEVKIGDTVQLWGDKINVDDVAQAYQTIAYELLCRITTRPMRKIINKSTQ